MNLTPQQTKIMELALEGLNTTEIAKELDLSPYTISTHLRFIRASLGVHKTSEAIKLYKKSKGKQ